MLVSWAEVPKDTADTALSYEHTYYVGVPGSKKLQQLDQPKADGVWETTVKVGAQCKAEFFFSRDQDMRQLVYPESQKAGTLARGPDDMGDGKHFVVRGIPGEVVNITLRVVDAKVAVTASTESKGAQEWVSQEGWERHAYFVKSLTGKGRVPLSMDVLKPGVFKGVATVGVDFDPEFRGFVEMFQVTVDGGAAFYPEMECAGSGEMLAFGPDYGSEGKSFLARSLTPGATFEVCLDLTAQDRRQIVTWSWVDDKLAI